MSRYLIGQRVKLTVTVTDHATGDLVDPATFAFQLKPPATGPVPATYTWNGAAWTTTEAVVAVPAKGSTGQFTLTLTFPYDNDAAGEWTVGWKSTANGGGYGEGSSFLALTAIPSPAL